MKTKVCFLFAVLLLAAAPVRSQMEEDVRLFELPVKEVDVIWIRHRQGSVSFHINGEEYAYFVEAEAEWQKMTAISAVLGDIQRATTVQMKSFRYGKFRKITSMILFFGKRTIPADLRLKVIPPPKSTPTEKDRDSAEKTGRKPARR